MCILLVEDEDLIRMVLIDVMTDAGFKVIEAANAESALALAETTPCPDVIVSDINLGPGMDGFALAAALRRRWPVVPVLMMICRETNFVARQAKRTSISRHCRGKPRVVLGSHGRGREAREIIQGDIVVAKPTIGVAKEPPQRSSERAFLSRMPSVNASSLELLLRPPA